MNAIRLHVRVAGLLSLLLHGWSATAWAWGCEGHETIARIAERHLGPEARHAVAELLASPRVDAHPRQFCRAVPDDVLADVSTWADEVRGDDTSRYFGTGAWHFVDIPRGAAPGELRQFCARRSGCIVTAIADQVAVLRAPSADRHAKAAALMMLVHLVGDLHQPMHCATNADGGGNCLPLSFFGAAPRLRSDQTETALYQPNLHAIWDTGIVRQILARRSTLWFADTLERRFRAQIPLWQHMPIDPDAWAWESHRVAERVAYGQLPLRIPVAPSGRVPQCSELSRRLLALHEQLGQRYQDAAAPVVEEQLAKAGIRLAMMMNQIWP